MLLLQSLRTALTVIVAAGMLFFSPSAANAQPTRVDDTDVGKELNLPVYEWRDQAVPEKGIIFAIHGATLYARRFEAAARHFAEQGYAFYALDLRGFGRWRSEGERFKDGDRKIHYSASEDDIVAVLTKLQEQHPQEKIYCMGESLGANLGVWVGSMHSDLVSGLILVSPCIQSYMHPGPRFFFTCFRGFLDPNEKINLAGNIKPYLSDDKTATAEYLQDPGINDELSARELIKSLKTNTLALESKDKIPANMPVLIVAGGSDKIYKASSIPPFAEELGSKHKTIDIVPKRGHLLLEYDRVSPEILGIIDKWLDNNTVKQSTIAAGASATAKDLPPAQAD